MSAATDSILKTQAIPLRWWPVTNTSRVVVWLTQDHGRVATLIKGDQRPKSAFLGQYDLFYRCELLFYAREHEDLHIARECAPLSIRPGLRGNWRATLAASHAAALCLHVAPPRGGCRDLFALLETLLHHLDQRGYTPGIVEWFDLALLGYLGQAPRLDRCAHCNRPFAPGDGLIRLRPSSGGPEHSDCGIPSTDTAWLFSPEAIGLLLRWQNAPTPRHVRSTGASHEVLRETHTFLREFLAHHIEFHPAPRDHMVMLLTDATQPIKNPL